MILTATGRLGSNLPFSIALTVCRETLNFSAKVGLRPPRSARKLPQAVPHQYLAYLPGDDRDGTGAVAE